MNFASIAAGIISGALGAMGLGGGGVLILYLTLLANTPQLKSQGINLMFFIPCALTAVVIYAIKKQIKPKELLPYIISGVLGAALGSLLSGIIADGILARLFGGALGIMGIKELFSAIKQKD